MFLKNAILFETSYKNMYKCYCQNFIELLKIINLNCLGIPRLS